MSETVTEYKRKELLKRYKNGETELEEQILTENMGLVKAAVYKMTKTAFYGADPEDLCQIGSIGLLKAIRRFDNERGVTFSTYAVPMIIGEIKKFLRDDGPIKIGRKIKEQQLIIRKAHDKLITELNREPTVSELEKETGISKEEIASTYEAFTIPESFDSPLNQDGDLFLSDILADERSKQDLDKIILKESLSKLSKEERKIILLRYFRSKTQQEVASILGMTQVQISRKEKKIIEKLRLLI